MNNIEKYQATLNKIFSSFCEGLNLDYEKFQILVQRYRLKEEIKNNQALDICTYSQNNIIYDNKSYKTIKSQLRPVSFRKLKHELSMTPEGIRINIEQLYKNIYKNFLQFYVNNDLKSIFSKFSNENGNILIDDVFKNKDQFYIIINSHEYLKDYIPERIIFMFFHSFLDFLITKYMEGMFSSENSNNTIKYKFAYLTYAIVFNELQYTNFINILEKKLSGINGNVGYCFCKDICDANINIPLYYYKYKDEGVDLRVVNTEVSDLREKICNNKNDNDDDCIINKVIRFFQYGICPLSLSSFISFLCFEDILILDKTRIFSKKEYYDSLPFKSGTVIYKYYPDGCYISKEKDNIYNKLKTEFIDVRNVFNKKYTPDAFVNILRNENAKKYNLILKDWHIYIHKKRIAHLFDSPLHKECLKQMIYYMYNYMLKNNLVGEYLYIPNFSEQLYTQEPCLNEIGTPMLISSLIEHYFPDNMVNNKFIIDVKKSYYIKIIEKSKKDSNADNSEEYRNFVIKKTGKKFRNPISIKIMFHLIANNRVVYFDELYDLVKNTGYTKKKLYEFLQTNNNLVYPVGENKYIYYEYFIPNLNVISFLLPYFKKIRELGKYDAFFSVNEFVAQLLPFVPSDILFNFNDTNTNTDANSEYINNRNKKEEKLIGDMINIIELYYNFYKGDFDKKDVPELCFSYDVIMTSDFNKQVHEFAKHKYLQNRRTFGYNILSMYIQNIIDRIEKGNLQNEDAIEFYSKIKKLKEEFNVSQEEIALELARNNALFLLSKQTEKVLKK